MIRHYGTPSKLRNDSWQHLHCILLLLPTSLKGAPLFQDDIPSALGASPRSHLFPTLIFNFSKTNPKWWFVCVLMFFMEGLLRAAEWKACRRAAVPWKTTRVWCWIMSKFDLLWDEWCCVSLCAVVCDIRLYRIIDWNEHLKCPLR